MGVEKANSQTLSTIRSPPGGAGEGVLGREKWRAAVVVGFAVLQATAQPGERRLRSSYMSRGRLLAWFV